MADLSWSQLSNWLTCGERFRLERVEKIPTPPTWPLVGGKSVHAATEYLDTDSWDIDPDDKDVQGTWLRVFEDTIAEAIVDDETSTPLSEWRESRGHGHEWWLPNGGRMVANWIRFRQEQGWRLYMDDPLQSIELYVDGWYGENRVRGYIDRLMVNKDGEPFVLDLKTGEKPPNFPMQLGIYADLLSAGPLNVNVAGGIYFMVATSRATPMLDLTGFTPEIIARYTDGLGAALDSGTFLPNPGMFCSSCGVREHCAVGSTLYLPPPAAKKPSLKPITRKETE